MRCTTQALVKALVCACLRPSLRVAKYDASAEKCMVLWVCARPSQRYGVPAAAGASASSGLTST